MKTAFLVVLALATVASAAAFSSCGKFAGVVCVCVWGRVEVWCVFVSVLCRVAWSEEHVGVCLFVEEAQTNRER